MNFKIKTGHLLKLKSECIVVGIYKKSEKEKGVELTASTARINEASSEQIHQVLARGDIDASIGSTLLLYDIRGISAKRVLIIGLGVQKKISLQDFRKAVMAAAKVLVDRNLASADMAILDDVMDEDRVNYARQIAESVHQVTYRYWETKSAEKPSMPLSQIGVLVDRRHKDATQKGIDRGMAIANALTYTKTIANLPGNVCTPTYLANRARELTKSHGLKVSVLDEKDMEKLKMGSLLSVSRGSVEPAKLIIMEYRGAEKDSNPVALIGKGLTFDAGGISIKPASAMDEMKYDMCGGASVFGAMIAASEMDLPLNIVGIVPSSENLPDGAANKPGDIVTSMLGKTIEILNTDAEGRLILCDAMTYAKRFKPEVVVDIATLTGACIIALGHHASGLFSNSDELANELLVAGEAVDDRAWRMPVWESYTKQLKSNFADLANIGGRSAGAVTAACFLQEFAKDFSWAHLDVAGTAWSSGSPKGATGRPVPLLVEFLIRRSEAGRKTDHSHVGG
ncbi:MAG: leucyl aminopeptidase [Gammaproteobacteria bacterium]|nr:leucyl aminopeptidase [Gammaproteobacteria bacterium]MCY4228155.1 leucyl aminopeptidase [Gammaproteobacteria bacterium]